MFVLSFKGDCMFRVGFYQFNPILGKIEYNRKIILEKLKTVNTDLLVLPELAFTGYNFHNKRELLSAAENPKESLSINGLTKICAKKNLYIVTGFAEKSGNKIYNSAILIGPKGIVYIYRKIHLFLNEKNLFTPGNLPLKVQNIKNVHIGMMICFDWIYPEITRVLVLKGADIICHPANLVLSYCQEAMITRCLENSVYAITANRFGIEYQHQQNLKFTGKSQIVNPKGEILYRAKAQKEELFTVDIDPELARNKKITEKNDLIGDRRPEFYKQICR
jgi:predicted amidohydrolase